MLSTSSALPHLHHQLGLSDLLAGYLSYMFHPLGSTLLSRMSVSSSSAIYEIGYRMHMHKCSVYAHVDGKVGEAG